jgi:hypothetical protein
MGVFSIARGKDFFCADILSFRGTAQQEPPNAQASPGVKGALKYDAF